MPDQDRGSHSSRDNKVTPRDAQKGGQGAVGKEHPENQLNEGSAQADKPTGEKEPQNGSGR